MTIISEIVNYSLPKTNPLTTDPRTIKNIELACYQRLFYFLVFAESLLAGKH